MAEKTRLGLVGLGLISKKAYMPVLLKEKDWTLSGCYSRSEDKRKAFGEEYRMKVFDSLEEMAENVDAVVINTSTDSHFEIASFFLGRGRHVLMDKPLAETVDECEKLVLSSVQNSVNLMVTYNRRFAPMYRFLKDHITSTSLIRIVKNRSGGIGPKDFEFTLKDDYIHLVDTARWLFDGKLILVDGELAVNSENQLIYAEHFFRSPEGWRSQTIMHRDSGLDREILEVVTEGTTYRVIDMSVLETEKDGSLITEYPSPWSTPERMKGFEDAILHFFEVLSHEKEPISNGKEALATQRMIDSIVKSY